MFRSGLLEMCHLLPLVLVDGVELDRVQQLIVLVDSAADQDSLLLADGDEGAGVVLPLDQHVRLARPLALLQVVELDVGGRRRGFGFAALLNIMFCYFIVFPNQYRV